MPERSELRRNESEVRWKKFEKEKFKKSDLNKNDKMG